MLGLSLTTDIKIKHDGSVYIARAGIALFGSSNMTQKEIDALGGDPFHIDFQDNFVEGRGITEEAARNALSKDAAKLSETLW